jgi:hypothetical protein
MNARSGGAVSNHMHTRHLVTAITLTALTMAAAATPYEDPDGYVADDTSPVTGPSSASPVPALLATYNFELVRLDHTRTTIYRLPDPKLTQDFLQPPLVDEATGRWALTFVRRAGKKQSWSLITGDMVGARTEPSLKLPCNRESINCFEEPFAFAAGSDDVLVRSLTRRGTTIANVEPAAGYSVLAGRSVGTSFALAPMRDRAAYATRSGITIVPWSRLGVARGKVTKVAVTGSLSNLVFTDDAVWFQRDTAGASILERYDLATGQRKVMYTSANLVPGWTPSWARARNALILVESESSNHDGMYTRVDSLVEVSNAGARVLVRDVTALFDVSDDGRYAAIGRGAELVVLDLETLRDVRTYPNTAAAAHFVR